MHIVFRESQGLEETETPVDLKQSPADLVVLSFSDSDLGAFAAGWTRARTRNNQTNNPSFPSLRLANLAALRHPVSVDTYISQTLCHAKGILVRLIGGESYWSYGLQEVAALARSQNIALAVLPGDIGGSNSFKTDSAKTNSPGPEPAMAERLAAFSTLTPSTLKRLSQLCETGGAVAAEAALAQLALAAGLYAGPVPGQKSLAPVGTWLPDIGACCALLAQQETQHIKIRPKIAIIFYRAYLTAADLAPIEELSRQLARKGFDPVGLYVPSLKMPEAGAWLSRQLVQLKPAAIINATAFSGRSDNDESPLDAPGVPVFQIALSTSERKAWAKAERGLSPSDLAMHVALPEVDGRIFSGVASFKKNQSLNPDLEYSRMAHHPDRARIRSIVAKVDSWVRLAQKPVANKKVAFILSTYPGKSWQMAHAVGLDALRSVDCMIQDLATAGYTTGDDKAPVDQALQHETISLSLHDYHILSESLPKSLRTKLQKDWGTPEDDFACKAGAFHFKAIRRGNMLIALQPERGRHENRTDDYHDLRRTPCHSYVAFYLWLRIHQKCDALVHVGAHGTLEWLPGKAVALGDSCWPEALIRDLPVIYPFIVNDPGEAAQARRRIAAVTLGHIPPPLKKSTVPDDLSRLESLLDEFSNADGLDPRRRIRLQDDIRDEARTRGVEDDLGLSDDICPAEAITRIDRYICDLKDSQFGDGLHVFGRLPPPKSSTSAFDPAASVEAEHHALLDALAGKRIAAGPAGSPFRGRSDVLPTGRNLYSVDPRATPTRAAFTGGMKLAEEFLRRHLQDEGDWPQAVVLDLWGSATLRTAGEEFSMALYLLGAQPVWDERSQRVRGVEILPMAVLNRPRIDVTLRISGLFRDLFPTLSGLFMQAVTLLAGRDEAEDINPYKGKDGAQNRVYGPAPAHYGVAIAGVENDYSDHSRDLAGQTWLAASAWAHQGSESRPDLQGLKARVQAADSFVHIQDMAETDLLLAPDYAFHEAGFAAAKQSLGGKAALYHIDHHDPGNPAARTLNEEIARVVRARASNPAWIEGMKRHGFRGGAEIAATLDHMALFAHLSQSVGAHLFDAFHTATLGNVETTEFLERENPQALQAMRDQFQALYKAGLWKTRRNDTLANLEAENILETGNILETADIAC